jgi:hypothetical protein
MKLKFISYGNKKFSESRGRIKKEAEDLNYFTDITIHTENSILKFDEYTRAIKNNEFVNFFNRKKGGGYWMWKPLVVYEELLKLNNNDILYYADSGCTIPNETITVTKLKKYKEIVEKHKSGILAFRNPFRESTWTKGDIFKHFDVLDNEDIYDTRQITANRFVIKKCDESMEIVKLWWNTAMNHANLFSDQKSKAPNFENFRVNRHDQSNWSVICKKFNVAQKYCWRKIAIKASRIRK